MEAAARQGGLGCSRDGRESGAKEDLQWCELLKTLSCSRGFQDPWR